MYVLAIEDIKPQWNDLLYTEHTPYAAIRLIGI